MANASWASTARAKASWCLTISAIQTSPSVGRPRASSRGTSGRALEIGGQTGKIDDGDDGVAVGRLVTTRRTSGGAAPRGSGCGTCRSVRKVLSRRAGCQARAPWSGFRGAAPCRPIRSQSPGALPLAFRVLGLGRPFRRPCPCVFLRASSRLTRSTAVNGGQSQRAAMGDGLAHGPAETIRRAAAPAAPRSFHRSGVQASFPVAPHAGAVRAG